MASTKDVEQDLFSFQIEDLFREFQTVFEDQIKDATGVIEREFNKNKFFTPESNREVLKKVEDNTRKLLLTNLDRLEMHTRSNFFCSQEMIEYSRTRKKNAEAQQHKQEQLEEQIGKVLAELEKSYQDRLRGEFQNQLISSLKQALDQSEDACIQQIQAKCAQQSATIDNYDKIIRQAQDSLDKIETQIMAPQ